VTDQAEPSHPGSTRKLWLIVAVVCLLAAAGALLNTLKVFEREASAGAKSRTARPAAVRVASVTRGDLSLRSKYVGEIDAESAELSAQVSGRILAVEVNLGDRVKRGDVLAKIDVAPAQREVAQARARVGTAEASRRRAAAEAKSARAELERGKLLRREELISEQELERLSSRVDVLGAQIDAAEAEHVHARAHVATLSEAIRDARLKAPFDGAVSERYLDSGAVVQPGTLILRLVKAGPLRARFRVPERDLGRVQPDMRFELTTHATGDRRFAGKVTRISAEVSRSDRTAAVEGLLEVEAGLLKPGMYAEVYLTLGQLDAALLVPSAAIVERSKPAGETEIGVFVAEAERAVFTPVTIRGRSGDRTALEGVAAGKQVITLGHEYLKDGAPVKVVEQTPP
jgi:RND family efflux transporter MFP subunit